MEPVNITDRSLFAHVPALYSFLQVMGDPGIAARGHGWQTQSCDRV
jgi:hypothetical protein